MKEFVRLFVTLTAICFVAGALLAAVNQVTREPIAKAMLAEKSEAMKRVLPPCDNDPMADTMTFSEDGTEWTFYVGRKGGAYAGTAFIARTSKGYGGDIELMVGVTADDKVQAIAVLDQKETPGLGANIKTDWFQARFGDRGVADTKWDVKKDGGDIDQITAATISSRAVVGAVKSGLDVYTKHRAELRAGAGK